LTERGEWFAQALIEAANEALFNAHLD